ncbi:hypothetical protein ACE1V3_08175 [Aeromonas veronii bv. sobria]|uniref:hypothetical protein n=1 Tax=Aeromonas veronii TaxID=654 RepID=UPI0035BED1E9
MKMHNKALLAIACAAALSACDGEKVANSIAKRVPLALPEAGLYQADLLSRESDKATHKMIPGMNGLALVYPKTATEQRWGVWVDYQDGKGIETNTQWVGNATQKADKDDKYPYTLELDGERSTSAGGWIGQGVSRDSSKAIIAFKDTKVIDTKGKEQSLWAFDFTGTGTTFRDNSPLYPNWVGHIAVTPLKTTTIPPRNWSAANDHGFANALLGQVVTTDSGGKLTVEIEFPAAGCKLAGQGAQGSGLNKLTVTGFDKCKFGGVDGFSPLENKWSLGLKNAKDGTVAYATAFNDQLVIGFPEVGGFMLVADGK